MGLQISLSGQELDTLLAQCQLAGCDYVLNMPRAELDKLYLLPYEQVIRQDKLLNGVRKAAENTYDAWQEQRSGIAVTDDQPILTSESRLLYIVYQSTMSGAINLVGQEIEQIDLERNIFQAAKKGEIEGAVLSHRMVDILAESKRRIIEEFKNEGPGFASAN